MMEFISIPVVVGIITLGIYKLFELFVKKKERLLIIEKAGDKLDASVLYDENSLPIKTFSRFSSGTLKAGCLLIGIGLGLLLGFFITVVGIPQYIGANNNQMQEIVGVVYGASVLLFGGLGLLSAFLLEMNYAKKHLK